MAAELAAAAVARLQAAAVRRGLRVNDAFADFDRLRTGLVSRSQFLRGLTSLPEALSVAERDALAGCYAGDAGRVRYRAFVAEVQSVLTEPGLEAQPTLRVPPGEAKLTLRAAADLGPELEGDYYDTVQVCRGVLAAGRQGGSERRFWERSWYRGGRARDRQG